MVLIADHAKNLLPESHGTLGLPAEALGRHIAYDIGIEAVTRALSALTGAPAIMAGFSRLLIDPNRGRHDPTLIRAIYDGQIVPGNCAMTEADIAARVALYDAYHAGIAALIAEVEAASGKPPFVVSLHSFTPALKDGRPRPWPVGLLWDRDRRGTEALAAQLAGLPDLPVGDNEPYDGALEGDTMYRHCSADGLAHVLIELRQDEIADEAGARDWAARLAPMLETINDDASLHRRRHFGSRVGPLPRDAAPDEPQGDAA